MTLGKRLPSSGLGLKPACWALQPERVEGDGGHRKCGRLQERVLGPRGGLGTWGSVALRLGFRAVHRRVWVELPPCVTLGSSRLCRSRRAWQVHGRGGLHQELPFS